MVQIVMYVIVAGRGVPGYDLDPALWYSDKRDADQAFEHAQEVVFDAAMQPPRVVEYDYRIGLCELVPGVELYRVDIHIDRIDALISWVSHPDRWRDVITMLDRGTPPDVLMPMTVTKIQTWHVRVEV